MAVSGVVEFTTETSGILLVAVTVAEGSVTMGTDPPADVDTSTAVVLGVMPIEDCVAMSDVESTGSTELGDGTRLVLGDMVVAVSAGTPSPEEGKPVDLLGTAAVGE